MLMRATQLAAVFCLSVCHRGVATSPGSSGAPKAGPNDQSRPLTGAIVLGFHVSLIEVIVEVFTLRYSETSGTTTVLLTLTLLTSDQRDCSSAEVTILCGCVSRIPPLMIPPATAPDLRPSPTARRATPVCPAAAARLPPT